MATTSGSKSRIKFMFWRTASAVPRYQVSAWRIWGGTIVMNWSPVKPAVRQFALMYSIRLWERYWTMTYMDWTPELTKLDKTKSRMRYFPPKGTAGFERSLVRG